MNNKNRQERNHFLGLNFLNLYESKFTLLVIITAVCVGFGMWQVVTIGDIAPNLLTLIITEIGAITGIRGIEVFKTKEKDNYNNTNTYQSEHNSDEAYYEENTNPYSDSVNTRDRI